MLDWQLTGKPVIVTGASSGIGAATAKALGQAGASVVLAGRDAARLQSAKESVESAGGKAHVVQAELTDIAAAEGVVTEAVEAFGTLYGIVHSASVFDPRPIEDTTLESARGAMARERRGTALHDPGRAAALRGAERGRLHRLDHRQLSGFPAAPPTARRRAP